MCLHYVLYVFAYNLKFQHFIVNLYVVSQELKCEVKEKVIKEEKPIISQETQPEEGDFSIG